MEKLFSLATIFIVAATKRIVALPVVTKLLKKIVIASRSHMTSRSTRYRDLNSNTTNTNTSIIQINQVLPTPSTLPLFYSPWLLFRLNNSIAGAHSANNLIPSGVPSISAGVSCIFYVLHHNFALCTLAFEQKKGWSCDCRYPHPQRRSSSSWPNLS